MKQGHLGLVPNEHVGPASIFFGPEEEVAAVVEEALRRQGRIREGDASDGLDGVE